MSSVEFPDLFVGRSLGTWVEGPMFWGQGTLVMPGKKMLTEGLGDFLFVFVSYSNEKIVGAKVQERMFTVIKGALQGGAGLRMGLSSYGRRREGPFGAAV